MQSQYRQFLELHTQAGQDIIENGHGTHASGFDYVSTPRVPGATASRPSADGWDGNDLDTPFLSRDRRFIIKVPR